MFAFSVFFNVTPVFIIYFSCYSSQITLFCQNKSNLSRFRDLENFLFKELIKTDTSVSRFIDHRKHG